MLDDLNGEEGKEEEGREEEGKEEALDEGDEGKAVDTATPSTGDAVAPPAGMRSDDEDGGEGGLEEEGGDLEEEEEGGEDRFEDAGKAEIEVVGDDSCP